MPRRPRSHVVADAAVEQFGQVVTALGWAWERIGKDYGEDILIQPSHESFIEPFRIWVQVKGTENIQKHYRMRSKAYSFSISHEHAIKWTSAAEPTVCVLWDVSRQIGYYSLPWRQFNQWELIVMRKSATVSATFDVACEVTAQSLARLGWMARLRFYEQKLGYRAHMLKAPGPEAFRKHHRSMFLLDSFLCLKALGVISDGGIRRRFWPTQAHITDFARKYPLTADDDPDVTHRSMLITLLILAHIQELTGDGCPPVLVDALPSVIEQIQGAFRAGQRKRVRSRR